MAQDRKSPPPDGQRAGEKFVFPTVRTDDPEDVSWALSTAEAMWNRGDHVEAVKWIRRAAEAASECEADTRALELAKAAAELSTQLDTNDRPTTLAPPPPAKLVSRQTNPPPLLKKALVPVTRTPAAPAVVETAGRSPTPPRVSPSVPPPSRQVPGGRPLDVKRRKSHANLGDEARAAKNIRVTDLSVTAEVPALSATTTPVARGASGGTSALGTGTSGTSGTSEPRKRARSRPAVEEIAAPPTEKVDNPLLRMSGDPDAWPTQAYGDELEDEHTRIGTPAYVENAKAVSSPPGPMPPAPAQVMPSQAVRVVVWRDQEGVRVAPQGTAVSAISIDAVLVALDPSADLASWLESLEKK